MSSVKIKKYQNYFFLAGLLLLLFMAYKMGFDTILLNLRKTGFWFLPIFGIWVLVYLFNAWSIRIIIKDGSPEAYNVGLGKLMKLTISAYAINYMTPLSVGGEPYKALKLKDDLGGKKATSSVLLYVMMHYVSHFFFWLISIPVLIFLVPNVSHTLEIVLWSVFLACVILILWAYSVFTKGIISNVMRIGVRIPYFGKKIMQYHQKNKEHHMEMDLLISDLYTNRKKDFIASLVVELMSRLLSCFEVYFMFIPLGVEFGFLHAYIIVSIATLIANIFFFAPMQMGTREGGYVLAATTIGASAGVGVFIGLCTRIRELFWILVGILFVKVEFPFKKRTEIR